MIINKIKNMIIDINNLDDSRKNDEKYRNKLIKRLDKIKTKFLHITFECEDLTELLNETSAKVNTDNYVLTDLETLRKSGKYFFELISIKKQQIDCIEDMQKIMKFLELSEHHLMLEGIKRHKSMLATYMQEYENICGIIMLKIRFPFST